MLEVFLLKLLLTIIVGLAVIEGARELVVIDIFGGALNTTAVHAAVTDNGASQTIDSALANPPFDTRITATAGGTAGDIKAIQPIITGTSPDGVALVETLPAFTVNTAGTVTSVGVFRTVTSITLPAHDGTGATTSFGYDGAPLAAVAAGVHAAHTDTGAEVELTTGISQLDVPRNITGTTGGTATDIKAIQVTIEGEDAEGNVITEVLPVFTVNTATTVLGAKAFKRVTKITIPAHDGTGATTAIGYGDVLGLTRRKKRKTVFSAFLAEVLEGTAPAELFDAVNLSGNTIDLNSALDGTKVKVEYATTEQ